jgi:hypothetical protein
MAATRNTPRRLSCGHSPLLTVLATLTVVTTPNVRIADKPEITQQKGVTVTYRIEGGQRAH